MYDERQENKAVFHQALWSYWLEEGQPGQLRIFPPQGMTLLHDGGVKSLPQVSASRLPRVQCPSREKQ